MGSLLYSTINNDLIRDALNNPNIEYWHIMLDFPDYELSSWGNARHKETKQLLTKTIDNKTGIVSIIVKKEGRRLKKGLHIEVAKLFMTKPEGGLYVKHKDNDMTNNHIINLYWTTSKDKTLFKGRSKAICQYNMDGILISEYTSKIEAAEALGCSYNTLSTRLKAGGKTIIDGYYVAYKDKGDTNENKYEQWV